MRLLTGKVLDVQRRTEGGFARGTLAIDGTGEDAGRTLEVQVQNENLVIREQGRVIASVPDLIVVLDEATALAIPTERVRHGARVTVVAIPCAPIWRTERGLQIAGPAAFGFEHPYESFERRSS